MHERNYEDYKANKISCSYEILCNITPEAKFVTHVMQIASLSHLQTKSRQICQLTVLTLATGTVMPTSHNFYFLVEDQLDFARSNRNPAANNIPETLACLKFMCYNPNVNYGQEIVSIYCNNPQKDWNFNKKHQNYYNNILGSERKKRAELSTRQSFSKVN